MRIEVLDNTFSLFGSFSLLRAGRERGAELYFDNRMEVIMDSVRKPNVATIIPNKKFTLKVMAYRALTDSEKVMVAREYLKQTKRNAPPTSGSATFYTTIGQDER